MNDTPIELDNMGAHGAIFTRLQSENAKPRAYFRHGAQYLPSEDDLPHVELSAYFDGVSHLRGLTTAQRHLADDASEYCNSEPETVTIERRDLKQRFLWEAGDELADHIE